MQQDYVKTDVIPTHCQMLVHQNANLYILMWSEWNPELLLKSPWCDSSWCDSSWCETKILGLGNKAHNFSPVTFLALFPGRSQAVPASSF